MYQLSEQQIEYILNDIRSRGVEIEDLQLNLLDHICCILEKELKEGGNFETFYKTTIKQFYKNELHEIQNETISLLTFKNFYAMKKLMIIAGAVSTAAFTAFSFFKIMHWPGTITLFFLAVTSFCFLFLPLTVLLKLKENVNTRNKWILSLGVILGILYTAWTLFNVQHWPGRSYLLFGTIAFCAFVFIPVFFFTGIKKPETKLNTIVISVMLVAATTLWFTLVRVKKSLPTQMYAYIKSEELLKNMQQTVKAVGATQDPSVNDINNTCEQLKAAILQHEIGYTTIPADYDQTKLFMFERDLDFQQGEQAYTLLIQLKEKVNKYNASKTDKIPVDHSILDAAPNKMGLYTNFSALNTIIQTQMFLVNEEVHAEQVTVAKD